MKRNAVWLVDRKIFLNTGFIWMKLGMKLWWTDHLSRVYPALAQSALEIFTTQQENSVIYSISESHTGIVLQNRLCIYKYFFIKSVTFVRETLYLVNNLFLLTDSWTRLLSKVRLSKSSCVAGTAQWLKQTACLHHMSHWITHSFTVLLYLFESQVVLYLWLLT